MNCDDPRKRIPLWDKLEELFAESGDEAASAAISRIGPAMCWTTRARKRALVGEVISTVALAGQISREFNVSDHGIDMEIEFKNDAGEATGQKLYLQLKSGDSYLRQSAKRRGGDVHDQGRAPRSTTGRNKPFPVMLVIRKSEGEIRWMEIRDWLDPRLMVA